MQIVISRGYGAGWASWASGDRQKEIAEYQPIVEYVAAGKPTLSGKERRFVGTHEWESMSWDEREDWLHEDFRALVKQMIADLGLRDFYTGGADGLEVVSVSGAYRVDDYDGNEYVTTAEDLWE